MHALGAPTPDKTNDFAIAASRALAPSFYRAPSPEDGPYTPKEYQYAGAEYCLARGNALIGDAPGLGKSCEAILVSNAIEAKNTVVICPASLILNWQREIHMWSTIENVTTYPILASKNGSNPYSNYLIVSYDMLRNQGILDGIMDYTWDHLILDECLAADTLVLTDRGWLDIIRVELTDLVWDGGEWVRHDGLVSRGEKLTINLAGVNLTPDHPIWDGGRWIPAHTVAGNENMLSQSLANGTENLPYSISRGGRWGAWSAGWWRAPAGARHTASGRLLSLTSRTGRLLSAGPAVMYYAIITGSLASGLLARMTSAARTFFGGYKASSSDAITGRTRNTKIMEGGGLQSGPSGASIVAPSWSISSRLRDGIIRLWNWTASTTKKVMSRVIFGGSRARSTCQTGEQSPGCSNKSTNLKPVYDIANAGPRQRFTIWTKRGALLVHNCHYLKDPKGNKRTKVICAPDMLPSVVGRITMATGTLLPNTPRECYNIIRLLDHSVIDYASLAAFNEYYYEEGGGIIRGPWFNPKTQSWENKLHWSDKVRNVPRNLADLQYRLRKGLMVRRLTSEVLSELPAMQWHPFPLATTPAMRKAMKHPGWKRAEQLYELDSRAFDTGIPVDGAVSTARRLLGEAKAPACADYVIDLLNSGVEKVVVAAWHLSVLAVLRERLKGYGLVYMDGSTSLRNKQLAVDTFQNDPKCRIILGQTKPLGEGHTLTAAQDVVVCEPDWVPGKSEQLLRRICRIGQEGTYTLGHIPVVPDTMDERILGTSITKDQNIYQALDA